MSLYLIPPFIFISKVLPQCIYILEMLNGSQLPYGFPHIDSSNIFSLMCY